MKHTLLNPVTTCLSTIDNLQDFKVETQWNAFGTTLTAKVFLVSPLDGIRYLYSSLKDSSGSVYRICPELYVVDCAEDVHVFMNRNDAIDYLVERAEQYARQMQALIDADQDDTRAFAEAAITIQCYVNRKSRPAVEDTTNNPPKCTCKQKKCTCGGKKSK
jgi:hypothetical protein